MSTSLGDHLRGSAQASSGVGPKSIREVLVQYRGRQIEESVALDAIGALTDAEVGSLVNQRTALALRGATLAQLQSDYESVIREFAVRHEVNVNATLRELNTVTARILRDTRELEWSPETSGEQERLINEIGVRYKGLLAQFKEDGGVTLLPEPPRGRRLKLVASVLILCAAVLVPLQISEWWTIELPPAAPPDPSRPPPGPIDISPKPIPGISIQDVLDPLASGSQEGGQETTDTVPDVLDLPASRSQGGAQEARDTVPARLIERVPAVYPRQALSRRIQGDVRLKVMVDEAGRVDPDAIEVVQAVFLLEDAAVEAVKQWIYEPARRGGSAIAMRDLGVEALPVRIKFRITR